MNTITITTSILFTWIIIYFFLEYPTSFNIAVDVILPNLLNNPENSYFYDYFN